MASFYHKDIGYWETNSDIIIEEYLKKAPIGTKEISPRPSQSHIFDGDNWVECSEDINIIQERLVKNIAKSRYNELKKGITLSGNLLSSDDAALIKLNSYKSIGYDKINWKTMDGKFIEIDQEFIDKYINCILDYTKKCFDVEKNVIDKIFKAKNQKSLEKIQIDGIWPSNIYE